jgi:putative ABC transport system ATP-binding protein
LHRNAAAPKEGVMTTQKERELVIDTTNLQKLYQLGDVEVRALDGVSLQVSDGELLAIMGTSGSGKSTLLNILGCLDRPTFGSYKLAGEEVSNLSRNELADVRNRYLGFVFQSFNLLARTSAVDNVALPLLYRGTPVKEAKYRAGLALSAVGLGERKEHHPSQLSGGQQQRVAIARALVGRPKMILADEPTGNLDSRTSLEIMQLFRLLVEKGITVVFVTHETEIAAFAPRLVVVRDGRIVEDRRQEPLSPREALKELERAQARERELKEVA